MRKSCGSENVTATVTRVGEVTVRLQAGLEAAKEVGETLPTRNSGYTCGLKVIKQRLPNTFHNTARLQKVSAYSSSLQILMSTSR